jgi:hypothetical protein
LAIGLGLLAAAAFHSNPRPKGSDRVSATNAAVAGSPGAPLHSKGAQAPGSAEPSFHSGPWGKLTAVPIEIEPPNDFIYVPREITPHPTWNFDRHTRAQVVDLLRRAGLTAGQQQQLLLETPWTVTPSGVTLDPSVDLVRSLNPAARSVLYAALAECNGNPFQQSPFTFQVEGFDRWFHESGLTVGTVEEIGHLLYRRGNSLCFSDVELVAEHLPLPERRRLMKTLSRQSTLLLKLYVSAGDDLDALVRYWGKGTRTRDIRPILESLAKVPGGASIDVVHLLPFNARRLLYTYPYPPVETNSLSLNCFWTSFNFFSRDPDDSLHDVNRCKAVLAASYYPAQNDPEMGDILVLTKPDGRIVHAAVYIASNVLFTKNGKHFRSPWILMNLEDMLAQYPSEEPLRVLTYRLKDS